MIKLVSVDMDATFLRDDKTYDVPRFKKVLEALKTRNIKFVVASGNGVAKLEQSFDEHDKQQIIFAGDNGNHIQYQGQKWRVHGMSKAYLVSFLEWLSQQEGYYPIVNSTQTNFIFGNNPTDAMTMFYRYHVSITPLSNFLELPDVDFLNVAVHSRHSLAETKQFAQLVMQKFPQFSAVTSGETWMDVFQTGGGKGKAIQWLQQKYGISRKNVSLLVIV